jgi:uncharacterized protein (DUF1499 family)
LKKEIKIMMYAFLILAVVICGAMVALSVVSLKPGQTGLINGRLRPCPDTPNCVCSEYPDSPGYIQAISFTGDPTSALKKAKAIIDQMNGKISAEHEGYLHAVFLSPLFRFKDDLEIRLEGDLRLVHIRSASRVGHSDLGANRKRAKRFCDNFKLNMDAAN